MQVINIIEDQNNHSFITPELTHRIELILHLLEHSDQLIIVKGDTDSGKTTLLKEIIKQDNSSLDIKAISITNNFSFEQFELSLWAAEARDKQKVPVLLLDDIDQIESNELNNLKLLFEDKAGIRFCLFCLPIFIETLEQILQDSQKSEEQHLIDIPPLTLDQTLLYIRNKYSDNPFKSSQFNEEIAQQVHQVTYGRPGRINTYCEQYLRDPALHNEEHKTKRTALSINKVLASVIILFAIISVLVFISLSNKSQQESKKIKIKLEIPNREIVQTEEVIPITEEKIEMDTITGSIPDVKVEENIAVPEPPSIPEGIVSSERTWLSEQEPGKYVLQLLGAKERKTIDLYRNSFADPDDQLRVITTLREGQEWHILIYGLYANRNEAKQAVQGLPARAKNLSPWPRTVASIKEQLD